MSNLVLLLISLVVVCMGGLMIKLAVDNYHDEHYFWFGFDIFVAIEWLMILIRLYLVMWGVEFNG